MSDVVEKMFKDPDDVFSKKLIHMILGWQEGEEFPIDVSPEDLVEWGYMGENTDENYLLFSTEMFLKAISIILIPKLINRINEHGHDLIKLHYDESCSLVSISPVNLEETEFTS